MIIDAHLHLDDINFNNPADAAAELEKQRIEADISHCVVLHLLAQNWSMEEFSNALKPYKRLHGMVNLNPFEKDSLEKLEFATSELNFIGLKLHPRLQKFSIFDESVVKLVEYSGHLNVPVLIDAFPDGTHLQQGFSPLHYANLANRCPNTKIIVAHMGGHYVLDFLMLAKRIPNIYFDISYSFLYYESSSIPTNMIYAMRSMKFERIFYGSDYPDRPLHQTLESSKKIFDEHNICGSLLNKVWYENASQFFGIK